MKHKGKKRKHKTHTKKAYESPSANSVTAVFTVHNSAPSRKALFHIYILDTILYVLDVHRCVPFWFKPFSLKKKKVGRGAKNPKMHHW